ncbi:MAG: respiratory nitrate reductase subunit gamma [Chloroflexi bacterium]|nr:respiratory nitrate reductase subunit gamma [Chloroflexota bacterium]
MSAQTTLLQPQKWNWRLIGQKTKLALRETLVNIIGQARILRKIYPGLMHFLIFWGVTLQVVGTAINLMQMQLFIPFVELPFPRGAAYLADELIMDLAGVAILTGVVMALFRRLAVRPKTLETRWDDIFALVLLGLIPLAGFTLEGARLLSISPLWSSWSPIGSLSARVLTALGVTPEAAAGLHTALFWTHVCLGLTLVASLPFTKMRHLVFTPLNILLRNQRKAGALEKIENIDDAEILGVGKITEFTSQQLLSFDACMRCGRCEEACPVAQSGVDYTPKSLIQSLRQAMVSTLVEANGNGRAAKELLGGVLPEDLPWSCTTCGACLSRCPAFINPVDEIIDLRRYQALTSGKLPKPVADTLRNMERQGNPWGMPPEERIAWAEGLDIREIMPGEETDVLLFLGCAFAFDERNRKVARAFASLLKKANVDFAILGLDEMCCGETARRLGHEYMFQMMAEQNIELLSKIKFKRLVTQCPHCFNTLKNEYPQMGGNFPVLHYTELLSQLELPWNGASPNGNGIHAKVTYHDSCYLGRYNQIYAQPRALLHEAKVELVEMSRRGEESFCCGGGGGQMWQESDPNTRINHRRLDDAMKTDAGVVATACPYCLLMFDDAIRSRGKGEQINVMDIAEVLNQQLEAAQVHSHK